MQLKRLMRLAVLALAACAACSDAEPAWQEVLTGLPGALLRVWGTGPRDVYAVGADADGSGPLFVHFDGERWQRRSTGTIGDLWWIDRVGDELRMVGEGGQIVRYSSQTFTATRAPTQATLFGLWGQSPSDVWYVGGQPGGRGVAFRDNGVKIRAAGTSTSSFFKVHGTAADQVTLVGGNGSIRQLDGTAWIDRSIDTSAPLLTVHGQSAGALYAVGGVGSGVIVRFDGTRWIDETPPGAPGLNGVHAISAEEAYAAGFNGRIFHRHSGAWAEIAEAVPTFRDLHSIWIDGEGGIWACGGQLGSDPPSDGVLVYRGPPIPHGLLVPWN